MYFSKEATLIIVDVQKGFDDPKWGKRNNLEAENNIVKILTAWRKTQRPIFHIQHLSCEPNSPLKPDAAGCEFKEIVKPLPHELVIQKQVNSAFIGTNLEAILREQGCTTLVIVGLTTNHCVSTTARMAGNLGFKTYVISDATATFERTGHDGKHYQAEEIHAISLANLHQEFATVIDTESLLSWL
jgi:nicotinamidase-related amidase